MVVTGFASIVLMVIFTFPFYWMVVSSLKQPKDVTVFPPAFFFTPTLDNYIATVTKPAFLSQLTNSFIVAFGALALGLVIGVPAAYAVARFRLRLLPLVVLIVRMIPGVVFMLPLFILYKQMGLVDTHVGLMFAHLIITLPLAIWIMIGFFEDIPIEVEEQAMIDGCTRWGVFWRIALPLSLPGMAVTSILAFITSWNDFVFVLILGGSKTNTLPASVLSFMGFEQLNFAGVAASAALLCAPVVLLAILAQRWLVGGLTMGAVK